MTKLDWRKAEDYKSFENISNLEWAWEFLRRNPEYKKAYIDYLSLMDEYHKAKPFLTKKRSADVTQTLDKNKPVIPKGHELGKKWLLNNMYDPQKNYGEQSVRFVYEAPSPHKIECNTDIDQYCEPQEFVIIENNNVTRGTESNTIVPIQQDLSVWAFDLNYNIKAQLKLLESVLLEEQGQSLGLSAKIPNYRVVDQYFLRHLRCLDAIEKGATTTEIINTIGKPYDKDKKRHGSQGHDIVSMAKNMARSGYKSIIRKELKPI